MIVPEHAALVKPSDDPNVPLGQAVHVVMSVVLADTAPATAYEPIGQETFPEHRAVTSPVLLPNVPDGHSEQIVKLVVSAEIAPATA